MLITGRFLQYHRVSVPPDMMFGWRGDPNNLTRTEDPMSLMIGIPREISAGEKRVATVPDVVEKLIKVGFRVAADAGAGDGANFSDDVYRAAGAEIIAGAAKLWSASDIVFKVRGPTAEEIGLMREGGKIGRASC